MKIELIQLTLTNFKGIRDLTINLKRITNIYGDNATGKTTVFDSFLWLLFGKNSNDDKDFEIKTLDIRNNPIHKADHSVSAILLIDGNETTIRRVYREKWEKKRGATEATLTGHETEFYWNLVPLQQKDYQAKIAGIVDESLFKLITNTNYFNSLSWQDRRRVLEDLAGVISDADIASGDTDFERLLKEVSGKSWAEFKAQISAQKKKLKQQLEEIPTRIAEARRLIPNDIDYTFISGEIGGKTAQLQVIEKGLLDEAEAAKQHNAGITAIINEVHALRTKITSIEFDIRKNINAARQDRETMISNMRNTLRNLQDEYQTNSALVTRNNESVARLNAEAAALRDKWAEVNKETFQFLGEFSFDENECTCPTCKQRLPQDNIETLRQTLETNFNNNKAQKEKQFNDDKAIRLNDINVRGRQIMNEIAALGSAIVEIGEISGYEQAVEKAKKELVDLETSHNKMLASEATQISSEIANNTEITELKVKAASLQEQIDAGSKADNSYVSELREKKAAITLELDELKSQMATKEIKQQQINRIAELEAQERDFSQQIADVEKKEFTILRFERAKMDTLETKVNSMFTFVKFKMFETQINGGEAPTCTTLIEGVPFSDANNAARINAGLDIIRVLSQNKNVFAPIFIDNAESVTQLLQLESQVIRLVVNADEKKLLVVTGDTQQECNTNYQNILTARKPKRGAAKEPLPQVS